MGVYLQILIEELLTTKKDAYIIFCDVFDELTKTQKEILKEEFSKPFVELYFKYLRPKALDDYDNFFPRFKKNQDADGNAWLLRRKKEVKKIVRKLHGNKIVKRKYSPSKQRFKTYSIRATPDQKKELFDLLIDKENDSANAIIDKTTKESTFLKAFSGRPIKSQPKIVFKAPRTVLYFLIIKFEININHKYNYNKINVDSKIFVPSKDGVFKVTLVNGINRCKDKSPSDYQESDIIVPLNKAINKILKK